LLTVTGIAGVGIFHVGFIVLSHFKNPGADADAQPAPYTGFLIYGRSCHIKLLFLVMSYSGFPGNSVYRAAVNGILTVAFVADRGGFYMRFLIFPHFKNRGTDTDAQPATGAGFLIYYRNSHLTSPCFLLMYYINRFFFHVNLTGKILNFKGKMHITGGNYEF
jgi:hypothetical protein